MAWQGEGNRSHEQDRNRRTGREIADKLPDVRTDESRLEDTRVVRRSALPANPRRQRRRIVRGPGLAATSELWGSGSQRLPSATTGEEVHVPKSPAQALEILKDEQLRIGSVLVTMDERWWEAVRLPDRDPHSVGNGRHRLRGSLRAFIQRK
jgi:hypothetical protein